MDKLNRKDAACERCVGDACCWWRGRREKRQKSNHHRIFYRLTDARRQKRMDPNEYRFPSMLSNHFLLSVSFLCTYEETSRTYSITPDDKKRTSLDKLLRSREEILRLCSTKVYRLEERGIEQWTLSVSKEHKGA